MAVSGHNGNNESLIGMSASIGLSLYDRNVNEIVITQIQTPIDLIIERDKNVPLNSFQYINTTQIQVSSFYLPNGFNLTMNNASIHIELKPLNWSIGYVFVFKLGNIPIINSTYTDFTAFSIFCPGIKL